MASINYPSPSLGPVKVLTEPVTADSDVAQSTDLAVIPAPSTTYVIEATLLLASTDPGIAGAVVGVAWPNGCADGVATIEIGGVATEGNVGANFAAQPGSPPGPGSWPATVHATFTAGEEPSGSFVLTVASSDGVTEVSVGAGSWLSVMALG